jgi:hypothetical protein
MCHRSAYLSQPALFLEARRIFECGFLSVTEGLRDRIVCCHAGDFGLGVLNDLAALDIDATDLAESSGSSVVTGMELSDNGEWFAGVDCQTFAVERSIAHAV